MEPNIFDKIHEIDLKKTMEKSYIDYAMSVIASRALPDVRDGLKPVQRRVLYSMAELNNGPDKPHRKSARIVGDTMGKYHPHGDSSIYGALVNMAQRWSMRYMLVDGHGNFGSIDGDGAAAMRYTEARLSKISVEMLADIYKDTVDFIPNFDETEKEPTVLPSRFPNLLVNGGTGIAVGMATNIPPHNLREVIAAVVKIIDNQVEEGRQTSMEEILQIIKGPDFPTGAEILGTRGIEEAYRTGRGKIRVRAVTNIETAPNGKSHIIVTELPYLVNKARLIEKIAELVKTKKIDGITGITDESNREGIRINIELRRDVNANVLLNQLLKHTQLQDSFGVIMLALVNNEPKVLNILQMLEYYLDHQKDVVTRRTKYDLNKAEERAHILEGLLKALDHIDEVIRIIRGSANVAEAKRVLMERFELTDPQAQAIVDMRLRALTGLEREKLENEYKELMARIEQLKAILADRKVLLGATARYMPTILGSQVFALGFCMLAGLITGYGIPEALFNIGAPCMSGGSGGAMTTLPALYTSLAGEDMTHMAGQFLCYASIANVLAVVMAAVGGAITSKMKGLNGNGDILRKQGASMQTESEKRPATSADYAALGSGIFMSFCLYLLGNILGHIPGLSVIPGLALTIVLTG